MEYYFYSMFTIWMETKPSKSFLGLLYSWLEYCFYSKVKGFLVRLHTFSYWLYSNANYDVLVHTIKPRMLSFLKLSVRYWLLISSITLGLEFDKSLFVTMKMVLWILAVLLSYKQRKFTRLSVKPSSCLNDHFIWIITILQTLYYYSPYFICKLLQYIK